MIYSKISQSSAKDAFNNSDKMKITGLIIAAGLSSRMGQFKPLLEWKGKTFLNSIIDSLKSVTNEIIIVTGNKHEEIEQIVSEQYKSDKLNINCVYNEIYLDGMFTSLKKGIDNCNKEDWILYHQVDQPNLPSLFYTEFVNQIDINYDWIQPQFNGRKGHPILFNKSIIEKIKKEKLEGNLRSVSNSDKIRRKIWTTNFMEILTDIDTPDDMKNMRGK